MRTRKIGTGKDLAVPGSEKRELSFIIMCLFHLKSDKKLDKGPLNLFWNLGKVRKSFVVSLEAE